MDIERFARRSCNVISVVVIIPFTLAWYTYKAVLVTGWLGPVSCIIFFVLGSLINQLTLPFVVRESRKVEKCEGDYRWKHAKIREHAESIAMMRGSHTETEHTIDKAVSLFDVQCSMANRAFFLDFSVNVFDYLGGILSYLCIAPLVFNGYYDDKDAGELAEIISATAFVIIYLVNQFTRIFDQMRAVADIIATGQRVAELTEFCNTSPGSSAGRNYGSVHGSDSFLQDAEVLTNRKSETFSQVDLMTVEITKVTIDRPNNLMQNKLSPLVSDLTLALKKSENLMITGQNGIGKTSLIRVCNGIWRRSCGDIRLPSRTLFLPQLPLLTNGSIKAQVVYPLDSHDYSDEHVKGKWLNKIQLKLVIPRASEIF